MRCTATTLAGKPCRCHADRIVGGLAVCEYHERWAARLFTHVQDVARTDPLVAACVEAVRRDARERVL